MKRLVCSRKRRDSDTILPLSNHYTIPEDFTTIPGPNSQSELQPWDSWDADDKQRNSANGRRFPHVNQRQTSQEEEPEPNYFEDMTPKIKKQKKVFIGGNQNQNQNRSSNLFAVSNDVPIATGSELQAWDDSQTGWEGEAIEDLSSQADAELREKRRQERLYHQQRKKQERDSSRGIKKDRQLTAVKLS